MTDIEIVKILSGLITVEPNGSWESPSFKLTRKNGINHYTYNGGELADEVFAINPAILHPYLITITPPRELKIADLEENYHQAVKDYETIQAAVPESVFKARLSICRNCPHWINDENFPAGYCDVDPKPGRFIYFFQERCPEKKWRL